MALAVDGNGNVYVADRGTRYGEGDHGGWRRGLVQLDREYDRQRIRRAPWRGVVNRSGNVFATGRGSLCGEGDRGGWRRGLVQLDREVDRAVDSTFPGAWRWTGAETSLSQTMAAVR